MDNEQLLTNGICPKCYRPLYESKHTDKILCDCGIMTQPVDRLKEIRDRFETILMKSNCFEWLPIEDVIKIQQASYNLGRDEVIEEIEKYREWAETYYGFDLPKSFLDDFSNKITSLKEKK